MKKISEKRFRWETILFACIFVYNICLLPEEWRVFPPGLWRVFLLIWGGMIFLCLVVSLRTLLSKSYFKKRFVLRNDERYREIKGKSIRNVGWTFLVLSGFVFGLSLGLAGDGLFVISLPLLPISIVLLTVALGTYSLSRVYYGRKM